MLFLAVCLTLAVVITATVFPSRTDICTKRNALCEIIEPLDVKDRKRISFDLSLKLAKQAGMTSLEGCLCHNDWAYVYVDQEHQERFLDLCDELHYLKRECFNRRGVPVLACRKRIRATSLK